MEFLDRDHHLHILKLEHPIRPTWSAVQVMNFAWLWRIFGKIPQKFTVYKIITQIIINRLKSAEELDDSASLDISSAFAWWSTQVLEEYLDAIMSLNLFVTLMNIILCSLVWMLSI